MFSQAIMIAALAFAPLIAQEPASTSAAVRWQYCAFESTGSGFVNQGGRVESRIRISMMTEAGCRYDEVVVSEAARSERERTLQLWSVAQAARAKALAQLGAQGWEVASGLRDGRQDSSPSAVTFYLKRRSE
jgi:hypothetical protein